MFHRKPVAAALIIVGLMATTTAQAAQQCLPPREAEALILALAPSLIQQVSTTCAANLPGNAYLRRSSGTLSAKFAGEADAAWPLAREAVKKVVGDDVRELLDTELARPLVTSMVGPMVVKDLKPADCPRVDRVMGLLDPLPAKNTAALLVAILEMAGKDKPGKAPLICTAGAPRQ